MSNQRHIRRKLDRSPRIALVDAHMVVNGCRIFLGHPDEGKVTVAAKGFMQMLSATVMRARCPNLADMYRESFLMQERIGRGEPILS